MSFSLLRSPQWMQGQDIIIIAAAGHFFTSPHIIIMMTYVRLFTFDAIFFNFFNFSNCFCSLCFCSKKKKKNCAYKLLSCTPIMKRVTPPNNFFRRSRDYMGLVVSSPNCDCPLITTFYRHRATHRTCARAGGVWGGVVVFEPCS
ncbi:hypothetical protein DFH27DRAFT_87746 [Peziza echinospora]|nr:hypothetical protein DFH27DRAFT_87746 [Peziza echinospora]